MARLAVKAAVRSDLTSADLVVAADGQPTVRASLKATQLEALVRQLALARTTMSPAVAAAPPDGRMEQIRHIQWRTGLDGFSGQPILMLRHPGVGWIRIVFNQLECVGLADQLRKIAELAARGTGSRQ